MSIVAPSSTAPVLAVQNIKGGVGKTSVAVNLAARLAARNGKSVLVIDADAQSNASLYLLDTVRWSRIVDGKVDEGTLYDLFAQQVSYVDIVTGEDFGPRRRPRTYVTTVYDRNGQLDLVTSSPKLFEVQEMAPELLVRRIRDWVRRKLTSYDLVIIDCPPSISTVSLAALRAADKILIPMKADYFSVVGLPLLVNSLKDYRDLLRIPAEVAGVLLTMVPLQDKRKREYKRSVAIREQIEEVCEAMDIPLLDAQIGQSEEYPISFDQHKPIPFKPVGRGRELGELDALISELGLDKSGGDA